MPYKILIVDDHPLVREGLSLLVATLPGGATVYTAGSAAQALEQAELHTPLDAILLDYGLPDADGGSLIRALATRSGDAPIIVVSGIDSQEVIANLQVQGAVAFIPKSTASSDVIRVLKQAIAHGPAAPDDPGETKPPGNVPSLTPRQLDALLMLNQGLTNREISLQLGVAEKTVKNHITTLFNALGAMNRLQAIRKARDMGLLH